MSYPGLLRGSESQWWRSLGGALIVPVIWLLLGGVVSTLVLGLAWQFGHRELDQATFTTAAQRYEHWEGMLAGHLQVALLIPICALMMRYVHQRRPSYLWSVEARPRWRFLGASAGVAVVVLALYVATMPLLGQAPVWRPQEGVVPFLVVIVLLTPFQAAAEEVFFRGYLLQTLGSLVANPWFGVVTSAFVFALFHGTQNPALFLSRFAFGLVVGILVLRSGGLEAAIAAHVINNVMAFGLAALTSSIAEVRAVTELGWGRAFTDVITYAVITALALVVAARMKVRRETVGS